MNKDNAYNLALAAFLVMLGCALGWWIIHDLIDDYLALRFLYGSFALGTVLLYGQAMLVAKSRERLVPQLLLFAGLYLAAAWTTVCLVIPFVFFYDVSGYVRLAYALLVISYFAANIVMALRSAKDIWDRYGALAFSNQMDVAGASVIWEKVAGATEAHRKISAVGIPDRWYSVVSNSMYVLAVVALYLAGLYPVFAVATWALPAMIAAGMVMQYASHQLYQAYRVWIWERDNGTALKLARLPGKSRQR